MSACLTMDLNPDHPLASLPPVLVTALLLVRAGKAVRGTTLWAPCVWAAIAQAANAAAALVSGDGTAFAWAPSLRYLAAATTLAPVVALLGGKRPQNRAWQFIVAALLIVLAMPVLHGAGRTDVPEPHALMRWLMAAILLVGVCNYLPTRFAAAALLVGAAQVVLLARHLPLPAFLRLDAAPLSIALWLAMSAVIAATVVSRLSWPRGVGDADRAWAVFRHCYGAAWSVRVAERFHVAMRRADCPIRLNKKGFTDADGAAFDDRSWAALPEEQRRRAERTLRALLLRFVSESWIVRRDRAA